MARKRGVFTMHQVYAVFAKGKGGLTLEEVLNFAVEARNQGVDWSTPITSNRGFRRRTKWLSVSHASERAADGYAQELVDRAAVPSPPERQPSIFTPSANGLGNH